jgi:fucose 4-O-acetylase-like acetyltransferase
LIGEWVSSRRTRGLSAARAGTILLLAALPLALGFLWLARHDLYASLLAIAHNEGKHPPEIEFMLFSSAGALSLLGVSLIGGNRLARLLRPITVIGQNALQAFIFHIFVIFIFYRYLFGYWQSVSYEKALGLTLLLVILTAVWIKTVDWVGKRS